MDEMTRSKASRMRVNGGMLSRHCIATAANQSKGMSRAMKSTKKLRSVADARKAKSLIFAGLKNRCIQSTAPQPGGRPQFSG